MKIIGYTYEADTHCVACASKRFVAPLPVCAVQNTNRKLGMKLLLDEHYIRTGQKDNEGNPIHPILSTDETTGTCGDCHAEIR